MDHFKLKFVTFLLFSSIHLVAQSDFRQGHLITLKGDTLTGLIDYQSDNKLCKRCRFKASEADRVKAFNPAELKGFQFDKEGREFVSTTIPYSDENKTVFLEILVAGKLNLYYCDDKSLESDFFIQRRGEKHLANLPFSRTYRYVTTDNTKKLQAIDSYNHIDTLKKYMQDMPDIYKSIEEIEVPKQNNLIKLVKQYDGLDQKEEQKQSLAVNHVKKLSRFKVYLTPEVAYSDFKLMPLNTYNIFAGVQVALALSQSNERTFFNTGLLIPVYRNYYPYYAYSSADFNHLVKVPLLFEYRFPDKLIQPRFSVGYNLYISDLGLNLQSSLSAGVNIRLSKRISLSVLPSIEFTSSDSFVVMPAGYDSFCLYTGLQIKL